MKVQTTSIKDLLIIEPTVHSDNRGFFMETFRKNVLEEYGVHEEFVQDNHSKSEKGVLRGLHYQLNPKAQGKLVRVIEGEVFDVAVDLRRNSPTFLQWEGVWLTGENKRQFYVPAGFAHGFYVASETAEFVYKCTEYYSPQDERGLMWNDPKIGIRWPEGEKVLSEKDLNNQTVDTMEINF